MFLRAVKRDSHSLGNRPISPAENSILRRLIQNSDPKPPNPWPLEELGRVIVATPSSHTRRASSRRPASQKLRNKRIEVPELQVADASKQVVPTPSAPRQVASSARLRRAPRHTRQGLREGLDPRICVDVGIRAIAARESSRRATRVESHRESNFSIGGWQVPFSQKKISVAPSYFRR